MEPTADELWAILQEHCGGCYRCCQNDKTPERAKYLYERLGRMQEIAKVLIEKS